MNLNAILKASLVAVVTTVSALVSVEAEAKIFRWSFQGDVLTLDPQDRRDTFTRDFIGN